MIQEYLQESWSDRHEDGKKKKRERLDFDLVGSNAKKDFQEALDFLTILMQARARAARATTQARVRTAT